MNQHTELFIGGKWRPAGDSARITVLDPATGQQLATVASATVGDGLDAVDAAAEALPGWAATAPRGRAELLQAVYGLMKERAEELAELIVAENGKALPDARAEISYAAEFFRWYAEEAVRVAGSVQTAPGGSNRIIVLRQPIGVSVLVTPWNFPAAMATRKVGPALAAGCTVVLKPAHETPLTALMLASLLAEAGAPAGVVNVLTTDHASEMVGVALDDARVRKLSFTGSTEVGRRIAAGAAGTIKRVTLELGGKSANVVFADADLEKAAAAAPYAVFDNAGQDCCARSRILVEQSAYDRFAELLVDATRGVRVGDPEDDATEMGPLISAAHRETVSSFVEGEPLFRGDVPDGKGYW
ncbi:MAG TPA: aldehyde dehydrogenase family protein, partial [Pseudonocardiaceae bacterium]|nr:aldehyde dehydrogenase family protein [Pseudonocardiaceae bacterium]